MNRRHDTGRSKASPRAFLALAAALLLAPWSAVRAQQGSVGAVRGVATDRDFGTPLPGARVMLLEAGRTVATSSEGEFLIERVPAGTYTLIVSRDGYERQFVREVVVLPGQLAEVRVELSAEVVEMDELVVTGIDLTGDNEMSLLEVRAEAVAVQDAISSEMLARAGASDVAGALKFVVGASVAEGKYATVRGLSDRYTGTTLDGVRLPSADPRRRAVQVDLFPTGTIENITVTKTFTPDLQGDFTGGGVDIQTRSIPEEPLLSASVSYEYNTLATGEAGFLSYQGGGVDPAGFDVGARDLPEEAKQPLPPLPSFSATPSEADLAASQAYDGFVRSFAPTIGVSENPGEPNYGVSAVYADRKELGPERRMGWLAAMTYSRKNEFYEDGINNQGGVSVAGEGIAITRPREDTRGAEELLIGALGKLTFQPAEGHEVSLQGIYNLSAEDEARIQRQCTGPQSEEQNQSLRYAERTVGSLQAHGSHLLGGQRALDLKWFTALSTTSQEEPDVRFFRNTFDFATLSGGPPANSTDAQNTRRIFRGVTEDDRQGAADLRIPFRSWTGGEASVKTGLFLQGSVREYSQDSFTYLFPTQFGPRSDPDVAQNRGYARFRASGPEELWTDVFLHPERIGLASNTPPAPNQLVWYIQPVGNDVDYDGHQAIGAAYGMADLPLAERLRLIAGARAERTDLTIEPSSRRPCLFVDAPSCVEGIVLLDSGDREIVEVDTREAGADIAETDILPAAALVYSIRDGMDLRGSWSRTLARPTFRELAPVATEEFLFGDEFVGNPDLVLSDITNYDLRWEWFFRPGDVLAASVFAKDLTNPIEQISFSAGGRTFIQPVNYESGSVEGAEVEARLGLGLLGERFKAFFFGFNGTLIRSRVKVPEIEQESLSAYGLEQEERRLQGQPEYLVNVNVSYDNDRTRSTASLFWNLVGETLLTGAARGDSDGTPNVLEERLSTLDFTFSQKIGEHASVAFKAKNLLTPDRRSVYRTPDGEEALKGERPTAILTGLSVSWTW